jgi:ketosteroid isomerase-like protein
MNVGRILLCSFTLVVVANTAHGKTNYERALDGKTKIWHNAPQRRVQASWSGDRDDKGYATGKGTLTWFRLERTWLTGSLLPSTKYIQVSQYRGKMVEGKLEGSVVSVDASGNTYHAKFANGRKTGDWVAGSLPSAHTPATEVASSNAPAPPAEAPPPVPKLEQPAAEKAGEQSTQLKETASQAAESTAHGEDSLQALAKPPSSLRVNAVTEPSPQSSTLASESVEETAGLAPASPQPSSADSMKDDDAGTVAALDTEYQAAVKTNDAATIDRILADDFVLVHGAGKTLSKTDLLKQARDKQGKYEHHEIEQGTQKVRVWRDTAVVTETLWVKGSENGKRIDQRMSVTETYVRTPAGWRYVSGQASTPSTK